MELRKVEKYISPLDSEKIRIAGEVHYADRPEKPEVYWYDIPQKYEEFISETGNPWLTCLLPLAMKLNESLKLCLPVDRIKLKNALELMRLWSLWYPNLKIVDIQADTVDLRNEPTPSKTAAFFSGGVDSFFTVLSHEHMTPGTKPIIDDFLIVWGMDIPLSNRDEFQCVKTEYQSIARDMKKNLLDIVTNIRETRLESTGWGKLYFGSAFCSCALMLEKRYNRLLFSAGGEDYDSFWKWGSHPFTDPLLSTSQTHFLIDGIGYNRLERLKYISQFEVVQKNLRVCWISKTDKNCCNCEKCYRTMLMLELLNCLDKFDSFENKKMDYTKLNHILIDSVPAKLFYKIIQKLAQAENRMEIANSIEKGFQFTRRINFLLELSNKLKSKRIIWRLSDPLRKYAQYQSSLKSL